MLFKRWRHIYNFYSISILIPITCSPIVCKFLTYKDILIIFIILLNLFEKFIWKWFSFYLPLEISLNSIAASAIVVSESIIFPLIKFKRIYTYNFTVVLHNILLLIHIYINIFHISIFSNIPNQIYLLFPYSTLWIQSRIFKITFKLSYSNTIIQYLIRIFFCIKLINNILSHFFILKNFTPNSCLYLTRYLIIIN